jgi:hypothetical protein
MTTSGHSCYIHNEVLYINYDENIHDDDAAVAVAKCGLEI